MPKIYSRWANVSQDQAYFTRLWGTMRTTGASRQMLELPVWTNCLHCLPSTYLLFSLLLRCQLLPKNSRLRFWLTLSQTNTSLFFSAWEAASQKHFHTTLSPSIALHSCGYTLYVLTNVALWFAGHVPSFCFHQMPLTLNWKLFFTETAHSCSPCTPHYMKSPDHDWKVLIILVTEWRPSTAF